MTKALIALLIIFSQVPSALATVYPAQEHEADLQCQLNPSSCGLESPSL